MQSNFFLVPPFKFSHWCCVSSSQKIEHPVSAILVYQWLNGHEAIAEIWRGPFAHFGISWSNSFAVFQICVKSCRAGPGGSLPNFAMPISASKVARSPLWGHTPLFCRYLTVQSRNRGKSKWREAPACWVTISTALIGRAEGGLAQFTRGSRNVKMVDGKPTQPRDSVFAASQVDCVCSMLTLPGDRTTPRRWHPTPLYAAPPGLPAKCGPKPPVWAYGVTWWDCHPKRTFFTRWFYAARRFSQDFPDSRKTWDDRRLRVFSSCYDLVMFVKFSRHSFYLI